MPTSEQLDQQLQRWTEAGVLDSLAAGRIRAFEAAREGPAMRWPVVLAIAFGSIMVAAGVLLFVAAHWDELSPTQRFLLVVVVMVGFHLAGGAVMPRLRPLGMALHAIGTVALGGGIFLSGQIFNLQEHWPGGILLWAIGAVLTWLVLRDWLQATLSALLVPAWIASEWSVRASHYSGVDRILFQFLAMLAITYLSARRGREESYFRRALVWAGGIAVLPLCAVLASGEREFFWNRSLPQLPLSLHAVGFVIAFLLPLLAAFLLRGKWTAWNLGYALWVYVVSRLDSHVLAQNLTSYALCALAAVGLVIWGLQETRRERINLGVAGFAITILVFYFSTVMGKLGRSASLIGFGILFLVGGWQLEKLRRKLVARTKPTASARGAA
ncbi:MAG TPA: DUF2157 domain-containing protein [Candidatus Sulfotelmatobacter sp.]|nr:DUF2157 domain-containing protein [Candidatus Sulfotelmatobacter sp.]